MVAEPQRGPSLEGQYAEASSFKEAGLPWRLLIFSIFIFCFSVFVFLGLRLGYGAYLDARSGGIDKKMDELAGRVSDAEQESLVSFYSQLVNIESVLREHKFTFNVLPFLEKNVLQSVYYESVGFSVADFKLKLKGRASSVDDVVGQLAVFDSAPEVSGVILEGVSFDGFGVSFDVSLSLKKSFFEKPF